MIETSRMRIYAIASAIAIIAGCGYKGVRQTSELKKLRNTKAKLALVSVSVNDYGARIRNSVGLTDISSLLNTRMISAYDFAHQRLGQYFDVIPATGFAARDEFQLSATRNFDVFRPSVGGKKLPVFATDRRGLIRAAIDATTARKLAGMLNVDLVAVVYSEWTVTEVLKVNKRSGLSTWTSKPIAKTLIGVYGKNGALLFNDRRDTVGAKVLHGPRSRKKTPAITVDEDALGDWMTAYRAGLREMIDQI